LSADDDIEVSPEALEFGFQVWQSARSSPVIGFVPRRHGVGEDGHWVYDLSKATSDTVYSIILVSLSHMKGSISRDK
jgi:hypothetical protein